MIKTKPWTGGTDEEYETQHFGFGAQRLQISVRQMVERNIRSGVRDMETYLQRKLDLNDTDKAALTHSCEKLMKLYCQRAGPSLDIIDKEIDKMVKIPPNVVLPEDEVQIQQVTDEEYEKLKEEVIKLRRRVERGALMESLLTSEEEEIASIESLCETSKKDMEVVDMLYKTVGNSGELDNIQNETESLCARCPV